MVEGSFPFSRLTRRASLGVFVALLGGGLARAACPPPRVLFVCPAGTVKSAIARETLRQRASEAGVPARVRSRGIAVVDHVSPALAQNLRADSIDPGADPAQVLASRDLIPGQIVIAFDEAVQDPRLAGARVWRTPSWNEDYSGAKAALAAQVDSLVAELRAAKGAPCPIDLP